MKRSRIELLREARASYRNGEPLGFGTDRIDDARYLFSGGYAVGVSAWNDDGTGYGEIREVTARGDDAIDEWDSRWTRRFADHGARVFYAFLAAFFLFLFGLFSDCVKARDGRRGAAEHRQEQQQPEPGNGAVFRSRQEYRCQRKKDRRFRQEGI